MPNRPALFITGVLPLAMLGGCGGGGGVASTPSVAATAPTPTPTSTPASTALVTVVPAAAAPASFETAEFRRSNGAAQAQAATAYANGATGAGVLVGVIDSGIDTASAEFAGRISPLSRDYAGVRGVQDEGGHGTAVADILLGARNDNGIHGVAYAATLLALRTDTPGTCGTMTGGGDGSCSHNDNAIAAALDGAVAAGARVVNISLGGSPANNALRAAIGRATSAGTIIVVAGGNDGMRNPALANEPDALAMIAIDPLARGLVIVAGAVDASGALAGFSNKAGVASATYLTALGVDVQAAGNAGKSFLFSGTSFSAPVIAGAVALLAQAFPGLTPAQLVDLLLRTATDRGATGTDTVYGRGELNLARAFQPQGALALTGSTVAISLTSNATLSPAMGDAAKGGFSATIFDAYGRAFGVDLGGTIQRSPAAPLVAPALGLTTRNFVADGSQASFALAIDERSARPQPMLLDHGDARRARVLAGAVALAVSPRLRLGIGIGRDADGLTPSHTGTTGAAFLIADRGLDRAPVGAFAVRRDLRGVGVTLAAETGNLRLWQEGETGPRSAGIRRYRYDQVSAALDAGLGPFVGSLKLTRLHEDATILGSRFGAAFGGNGANSWFGDATLALMPGRWRVGGTLRQGWTQLGRNELRGRSTLTSRALAVDISRTGLLVRGDRLALRYAEPLRVTGGALTLGLPGLPTQALTLAPAGHERDWEAAYARALGGGWLSANAYLRQQAGNVATVPTEVAATLRWSRAF